ncbi:MAG: Mrp/NBP35 family ATP-binding protein [Planctomycetota bacterium]|nr:Mrp/NBP35 family ATP-binding protein [Planctomycetota bacterium]
MSVSLSEADITSKIHDVIDPEIGRSLSQLQMVESIEIDGTNVRVCLELPTPAYPDRGRLTKLVQDAVAAASPGAGDVQVRFTSRIQGKNTGGSIGLRVKNVVCVGSGKGGVGKSTVAACLAYGLKEFGAKVGLMDADVYGPSIPHMLGAQGRPLATDHQGADGQTVTRIEPIEVDGLKLMSMAFFVEPEKAVVWRGPMLHRALTQFLKDTDWGELDYLIIDLPPGTGDVSLTLSQLLGLAGAVVVCTPQQVALLDAVKALNMYEQVKVPVLGIVENMSGEIFGRGGAKAKAAELGIRFLGEIPIEADIRIKGDEGRISALFSEDSPARPHLLSVCEQVAIGIARQLLESPGLPTLEVL